MIITRNAIGTGRISWVVRCVAFLVGRSSEGYTRRRASDAYERSQGVQALEQSMLAPKRQAQGIIKIKLHRPSVSPTTHIKKSHLS